VGTAERALGIDSAVYDAGVRVGKRRKRPEGAERSQIIFSKRSRYTT
jgi:hypothetical protein